MSYSVRKVHKHTENHTKMTKSKCDSQARNPVLKIKLISFPCCRSIFLCVASFCLFFSEQYYSFWSYWHLLFYQLFCLSVQRLRRETLRLLKKRPCCPLSLFLSALFNAFAHNTSHYFVLILHNLVPFWLIKEKEKKKQRKNTYLQFLFHHAKQSLLNVFFSSH